MKTFILLILFALITQYETLAQTEFKLDPSQSMLMSGKGPGQDGAINPYYGQDCYAIVENIGESDFSIRVQQKGKVIKTIPISSRQVKKVKLLKGYELYFDSNSKEKVEVKLGFEKMKD